MIGTGAFRGRMLFSGRSSAFLDSPPPAKHYDSRCATLIVQWVGMLIYEPINFPTRRSATAPTPSA